MEKDNGKGQEKEQNNNLLLLGWGEEEEEGEEGEGGLEGRRYLGLLIGRFWNSFFQRVLFFFVFFCFLVFVFGFCFVVNFIEFSLLPSSTKNNI